MNKIINPHSVAILMATYNGEKYLRDQIESILVQTCTDWTLYVQDDSSTDSTIEIIKKAASLDDRIVFVDRGLSHQGPGMNFMSLLNIVESEYYMFCDQDDVWFCDKISMTMQRMKQMESAKAKSKSSPVLVHTSRTITDSELHVKIESEFNPRNISETKLIKKIEMLKDPNILAIYTIAAGNTMMLNHAVKDIVFPFCNVRYHDSVCAMAVADAGGIIDTIIEPTLYYRQHASNTVGVVADNRILPKLIHLHASFKGNMRGYHIWKIYGKNSFFRFLYYRLKYFFILRLY